MAVSKVGNNTSQAVQSGQVSGPKGADRAKAASEARADKAKGAGNAGESARAEISTKAREFSKAKDVAASAPDVREEKIAELKKRIASGQYKVDADAVAERMIQDHAAF